MVFSTPLVSVIIPTYNHGSFIEEALESVLAQTHKNIELIVVDDGSIDNTKRILSRYREQIRYIYQDNRGPSSARNRGISIAKGEYLAFLDSDDVWLPEKLELQLNVTQEDSTIGLVGCGGFVIDSSGNIEREWVPKNYTNQEEALRDLQIRNSFPSSASGAFIRKECFDSVGLFDEHLRFGEDWDMWLRIARYYKVCYVEKPLIKFRRHNFSKAYRNEKLIKSNVTQIIEKNLGRYQVATRRRAYSSMYLDLARVCLSDNRKFKSAMYALRAITSYPFKIYADDNKISLLIKSAVPETVLRRLKRLKSLLVSHRWQIGRTTI